MSPARPGGHRVAPPAARRTTILLGAVLMLVLAIATGAEATTLGGVVPDVPSGAAPQHMPTARIANLPYDGGPVLHSNRTHLIFWAPQGSGLAYDPGYIAVTESFLAAVAADSHEPTNVYSLSGQYRDSQGPAAYASTYGGAVLATDPLPANGCTEPLAPPLGSGPGWNVCLSDQQLQDEIEHVVAAGNLPIGPGDVYFLVTPNGLGSCQTTGPISCTLGGQDAGGNCGYHGQTLAHNILFALIPFNAVADHCQSGNPRPNSSPADPALSSLSHEHNEIVTDPGDNAWIDGSGHENGDLCIGNYGPELGGSGTGAWNQVIHGGHYYLQDEWSNENGDCEPRDEADAISFSAPARAVAGRRASFTAQASDPDGAVTAYDWFFGDGTAHSRVAGHSFRKAGVYRVLLRITDRAGNWAFAARTVRISKAPAKHHKAPRRTKRR